jgi:hypothetical protein
MARFEPHEYVRVINIDNEPVRWQYLPSHSESIAVTSDPMKITTRGEVEVYLLNPGESEVLLGENAYLMIEVLYKQLIAKRVVAHSPDLAPGQARNFNFSDAQKQEEYINRILIGKETPTFGSQPQDNEPDEESKDVKHTKRTPEERELKRHLNEQVA